MTDRFVVREFSSANLFLSLSNVWCTADEAADQARANYLVRYLNEMDAKTIVVESTYTDGDFLEDFASYYVRCDRPYERRCKRLHFFSTKLTAADVRALVLTQASGGNGEAFRHSYIGFVVARPLPNAIVGRTLLRTYGSDGGRRNYTVVRDYPANFFGVELSVLSLPYQEQDSVLAACATVSLWCAFHMAAKLFGTAAPRPAAITRTANRIGRRGRPVPSRGLRIEQMCYAVTEVGLEPELIECVDKDLPIISLAYGHLAMGMPVILIVAIGSALHAITLTGYSLKAARVHARETVAGVPSPPMVGLRIDEFYGHDDQVGPFSRLAVRIDAGKPPVFTSDAWLNKQTGMAENLVPVAVLIPVYNKIRVTFLDIHAWLSRINDVLLQFVPDPNKNIEWDVRLTPSNLFKAEIGASTLPDADREFLLLEPLPRFLWRAQLQIAGKLSLELLFDATDMARSLPVRAVVRHDTAFVGALKTILGAGAMQASVADALTPRFLDWLKANL